ncbi:MAG: TetR/AcrR family transcriptional regulator C-terminal domain-containing protein [Lachnospiraceae bacterium]|nr:TetR/AcrR family transcriptional regulator C-terminal domain-containing protein [Lachnospiraceae bacterium]
MMRNRTKQLFADTLLEMSKTKPIREIQVKDLCLNCGADRTTFYYHFRDKYDLVAWIYMSLYLEEEKNASIINGEDMIIRMLKRIWTHKAFFRNALQDTSQNNLGEYLLDFYISNERKIACKFLGSDTLDEETEYLIKQYSFGCLLHTVEWLLGKNNLTAEAFGHYQYMCMPDILKAAWMKDAKERQEEN